MKNNYTKKLNLALVFILLIGLSGCQLAKENSQENQSKLCGIFVTYKLEDEKQKDKEIDTDKKYYANFDEDTIKQDNINKKETENKYKFEGLNGYSFFSYEDEKDNDKILRVISDNEFKDGGVFVKIGSSADTNETNSNITTYSDNFISKANIVSLSSSLSDKKINSQEYELNATIYVTSKFKGSIAFNPIIKEGKKFYTILSGDNNSIDTENGLGCSISKSNKNTIKDNNNKKLTQIITYKINIEVVDKLKGIKIKEIDDHDTVINTQKILQDNYEFRIGKNTAYIIIEENYEDKDGKYFIKRTILNRNDIKNGETMHICNYDNKDGIVTPKSLYIKK